MFKLFLGCLVALTVSFGLSPIANADDTITLQSGQKVVGQILQQTPMYVTLDVQGAPETYYLAEIVDINGQAVPMPEPPKPAPQADTAVTRQQAAEMALEQINPSNAPFYSDEEGSLIKFMSIRSTNNQPVALKPAMVPAAAAPVASAATTSAPAAPVAEAPATPPVAGPDKAVVATPDGGIVVVTSDKITKYDRDFKVVKQVDLAPVAAAPPVSVTPAAPVVAPPVPAADASTPAAPAAVATPAAPAAVPAADQSPPTLKDFLGSVFSSLKKS